MLLAKLKRRAPWNRVKGLDLYESLVAIREPNGSSAEAYRALRTNLLYAFVDSSPRVIVITSPGAGEGKTTTCANLGVTLAQVNGKSLIVDCDLRKPNLHMMFGVRNLYGFTNVLRGEHSLQEACHTPFPGLNLLTAGPIPPDPTELLSSRRLAGFIDQAHQQYEYMLIDAPPVRFVSDPVIIARHGDGVLLVFDAQSTRKGWVRQSVRSLENVGARVLGVVMNNAQAPTLDYYG